MDLEEYFKQTNGFGVLSTAGAGGRVDSAVYAKPYVAPGNKLVFVMGDRLTRANLLENPRALYLFKEDGTGYRGKRIFLKKEKEEAGPAAGKICREAWPAAAENGWCEKAEFAVWFSVESVLPLIGPGDKET